jgi:hypothetical protein
MTLYSYNGFAASIDAPSIGVQPFTVAGVDFPGGVRGGDVATVLRYVATQYHARVQPLASPGCWGWSYRQNRNANNLSCHASGTAIDINAPKHPNGIEASENFTARQIAEIHAILAEVDELDDTVHWGGDWHKINGLIPDPMHFEIHGHDLAMLARVAARIRAKENPDMALLADLTAVAKKHEATLLYAARVLLRQSAANAKAAGRLARLARINTARTALKGLK